MGAITKTKAGNFLLTVYDEYGNRIRKTFRLKKDATALLSKTEEQKRLRGLVNSKLTRKRVSFNKAIRDFQSTKNSLSPKSITKYNFTTKQFQYFLDSIGVTFLGEFTSDHATTLQSKLMEGGTDTSGNLVVPSPKTTNGFISIVKALFKDEVNKAHIDRNPFAHIKNLKEEKPRPEFYTVDELNSFFSVKMKDEYRSAFLGLFYTGVRFGELANISWDDIDLNRKLLFIRPKENHTLKTNNAQRILPIPQPLFDLLNEISNNKKSETYVFCSVEGKQLRERKLLEACKRIGIEAGITERMFLHKFRHTFATMLVQRKVDITEIQKLMGHASILETMIYVHVRTEDLHDTVNVLSDIIALEKSVTKLPGIEFPVFSVETLHNYRDESLRKIIETALQPIKLAA